MRELERILRQLRDTCDAARESFEGVLAEDAERIAECLRKELSGEAQTEAEVEYASSIEVEKVRDGIQIAPGIRKTRSGELVSRVSRLMEFGSSKVKPRPVWGKKQILKEVL